MSDPSPAAHTTVRACPAGPAPPHVDRRIAALRRTRADAQQLCRDAAHACASAAATRSTTTALRHAARAATARSHPESSRR